MGDSNYSIRPVILAKSVEKASFTLQEWFLQILYDEEDWLTPDLSAGSQTVPRVFTAPTIRDLIF
jgi:hypothetical protein